MSELVRLTKDRDFKQHLQWSPDGKRFLFTRLHFGKMGLWTMNADGSNVKPLLGKEAMPHFDGSWQDLRLARAAREEERDSEAELYDMMANQEPD